MTDVRPTVIPGPEATSLPSGPKAPKITNAVWLNTEPLSQDKLDGKVVLIDFWTFG